MTRNQKGLSGDGLSLLHGATLGINNPESSVSKTQTVNVKVFRNILVKLFPFVCSKEWYISKSILIKSKMVMEHKFMCPTYSEAKQCWNVWAWSRQRFIAGPLQSKKTGDSRLKNPWTPWKLSGKPFYRKGEVGTWLVVANFLVSDPLLLRSGHSQVTTCLLTSPKKCSFLFWQEGESEAFNSVSLPPFDF